MPGHSINLILSPDVKWTTTGKRGYIRNPPEGLTVDAIFMDWKESKLRREIREEIYLQPPNFLFISRKICATHIGILCPSIRYCEEAVEHLKNQTLAPEMWQVLYPSLRRAIILLAIFGEKGMRRGGYLRIDIKRMVGLRGNGPTERLIKDLIKLGFLKRIGKKGQPRYKYQIIQSHDYRPKKRRAFLQKMANEIQRRNAKRITTALNKEVPRYSRTAFLEGKDYSELDPGILIGDHPPDFIVQILSELSNLVVSEIFDELLDSRIVSRASGGDWKGIDFDKRTLRKVYDSIQQLMELCDNLSTNDAKKWEEYRRKILRGELSRQTFIIYDVQDIIRLSSQ